MIRSASSSVNVLPYARAAANSAAHNWSDLRDQPLARLALNRQERGMDALAQRVGRVEILVVVD